MIRLTSTTQKLQAVLAGTVTTNQLKIVVGYADKTSTFYTGGVQTSSTNNTTQVDICNAPVASTIRDIDYISIYNYDTVTAIVSIIFDDNGTDYIIVKQSLESGKTLNYTADSGWSISPTLGSMAYQESSNVNIDGGTIDATPLGGTTPAAGTFTTLASTGNTTLGDASGDTVAVQAGTAALPTIIPSGDANTGIWFPAADTVAVSTGGTERMRIDTSGNVGIGAVPSYRLHVEGSGGAYALIKSGNTDIVGLLFGDTDSNVVGRIQYVHSVDVMQFFTGGSERMRVDASGNVLVTSAAGLGYGTGAGGTVTQATSKSTGVTLNKPTGQITLNGASLAAGTIVSFTLTNSLIAATDTLILNHQSVGTLGAYTLNAACSAGTATISIRNNTAGALAEAIVLNFNLIKGVTA